MWWAWTRSDRVHPSSGSTESKEENENWLDTALGGEKHTCSLAKSKHTHTHRHTRTQTCMHTHTHECTHIRTHTHMHAHANTHMHTGTHTCKHTHTQKGYSQISETLPTKHSTWFTCYNFKRKIFKSMWILKKVYLFPYKIILLSEPEFRKSSKHKKLLFFSFSFFSIFFHGSRPSTWI